MMGKLDNACGTPVRAAEAHTIPGATTVLLYRAVVPLFAATAVLSHFQKRYKQYELPGIIPGMQ